MSTKPFFMFGNTGSGYNINVDSLKFNNINTGFVYLGNTGLAGVKQVQTSELEDSSITTTKIADGSVSSSKIESNINLTGIPTVVTGLTGTNTNQIASTAFVQSAITNLVNIAPSSLDTLDELANALGDNANFSTTVTNDIAGKFSKSGNEQISGIKTFTVLPECSSVVTTANQLTNKSYVDSQVQSINYTQGFNGNTGSQGSQGLIGSQGAMGAQGTMGAQGATGARGATGAVGTVGGSTGILVSGDGNTATTMYPVFTSGTGSLQSLNIDNVTGPLSYIPSTSSLTCANLIVSNPIISSNTSNPSSSGQLGYVQTATFTSQSLSNGVLKNLGLITLASGTWFVILNIFYPTNSAVFKGYSCEISNSSTAYNSPNDYSFIQETYPNATSATTRHFFYNTCSIYYSGSSFTRYVNIKAHFTGSGASVTASGGIQAIRIA